jgi:hypothetical protein
LTKRRATCSPCDAAADTLQFIDCTDRTIALEFEQLLPDGGVADAGGGLDDALLVKLVAQILEQLEQKLEI